MKAIVKSLDKLKSDESYNDILCEIKKHCENELNNIKLDKYTKSVYKNRMNSPFASTNSEFKSMFERVKIIDTHYERADYHVLSSKHIEIGDISFYRTYTGDNEGIGNYYSEVSTEKIICLIGEESRYKELTELTYSNEDYGNELLNIYKSQNFKKITKGMFIKYVIYVLTEIMDNVNRQMQ